MSSLEIACPECGSLLKLPDRSLLGRRGKCGKCNHRFVLTEKDVDVELEPIRAPQTPMANAGAPHSPANPAADADEPALPDFTARTAPASNPFATSTTRAAVSGPSSSVAKSRNVRRRGSGLGGWIAALLVMVGLGGAGVWFLAPEMIFGKPVKAKSESGTSRKSTTDRKGKSSKGAVDNDSSSSERDDGNDSNAGSTSGDEESIPASVARRVPSLQDAKPITAKMLPDGVRILLHLYPSRIWSRGNEASELEEFRAAAGPLAPWLAEQIRTLTGEDPAGIEELTLGMIPGLPETVPDVAAVVRLKSDRKKSELLDRFKAVLKEDADVSFYAGPTNALVVADAKTFAVGPVALGPEMARSAKSAPIIPDSIAAVLSLSDRRNTVTLVFDPQAVRVDLRALFSAAMQPAVLAIIDWFGESSDAVAMGIRLSEESFVGQLLIRGNTSVPAREFVQNQRSNWKELPGKMAAVLKPMPPNTAGRRQLIGRFPAMLQAVAKVFTVNLVTRTAVIDVELPERAGPNLVVAGLLTFDHLLQRGYWSSGSAGASGNTPTRVLPDTVAARLASPVTVDFRRAPLYQAVGDIADQLQISVKINGDDLRDIGVTQNIPQEFSLEGVPAVQVLRRILEKENLCLLVDEPGKRIIISTVKAATERGDKMFPLAN